MVMRTCLFSIYQRIAEYNPGVSEWRSKSMTARKRIQIVHMVANEPVLQNDVAWAFGRSSPGLQSSYCSAEICCGCGAIEPRALRLAHLFTHHLADCFKRQFGHGCYLRKRKGRDPQAPASRLDLQKSS